MPSGQLLLSHPLPPPSFPQLCSLHLSSSDPSQLHPAVPSARPPVAAPPSLSASSRGQKVTRQLFPVTFHLFSRKLSVLIPGRVNPLTPLSVGVAVGWQAGTGQGLGSYNLRSSC